MNTDEKLDHIRKEMWRVPSPLDVQVLWLVAEVERLKKHEKESRELYPQYGGVMDENQRLREAIKADLYDADFHGLHGYKRIRAALEGKDDTNTIKSKNFVTENQRLREALKEADKALQHYSGKYKHTANEARDKIKAALEGKDETS